jgi:hypothetical protein
MSDQKPVAATNGSEYVPYDRRTGEESVVPEIFLRKA